MNIKKMIKLIMDKISIKPKQIKDIQIMEKFSFITVPFDKAEKVVASFHTKGKRSLVSHAKKR